MRSSTKRAATPVHDEDHLLAGLTEGAKLTTETLFSSGAHLVVDASHVTRVKYEGLSVVPIAEAFSDPTATFLGFGFPNVFLCLPRGAPDHVDQTGAAEDAGEPRGWDRFAAFMFWRQAAYVANTRGRVQGGVFVELRGLPADAVDSLREAMENRCGHRSVSCANATGRLLTEAGFTSDGRPLSRKIRPMRLARAIWDGGLEYRGQPIELRIIRTSPGTVTDHFTGVMAKEATSLFRAIKKVVVAKREKLGAPHIEPQPLGAPVSKDRCGDPHLELRVGRPSKFAVLLNYQLGEHPIFEAVLRDTNSDIGSPEFNALHSTLRAYPGKLDMVSRLKRYVLFSGPVVKVIRHQLATDMDSLGRFAGPTMVDMFKTGSVDRPFLYNVVITGTSARMTRLENRTKKDVGKANWLLAKHVLLSGYDRDVRFAGEIWVEDTPAGRIMHINNNSGTYKPTPLQTAEAARFLSRITGVSVEPHVAGGPEQVGGDPLCSAEDDRSTLGA